MLEPFQTLLSEDAPQPAPPPQQETTPIEPPLIISAATIIPMTVMTEGMTAIFQEDLTMIRLMMMVPVTNPTTPTTPMTMYKTI
jgi:hypothetical protein